MEVPTVRGPLKIETLPRMFKRSAQAHPDKVALLMEREGTRQEFTYRELEQRIEYLARSLRKIGYRAGDKIGLTGENCPDWEASYLGIQWAGCIVVPLDRMLKVAEVRHILRNSDSKGVISTEAYTETVDEALSEIDRRFKRVAIGKTPRGWLSFESLITEGAELAPIEPSDDIEDLAAVLYTSGTTGQAKGVMLTHANIGSNVCGAYQVLDFGEEDTFISVLPLHHSFEATCGFLTPLCCGCKIVFSPSLKSKEILDTMAAHGVTLILGVPLLYEKIVEGVRRQVRDSSAFKRFVFNAGMNIGKVAKGVSKAMFSSVRKAMGMDKVRFLVSGAAALAPWASSFMERLGLPVLQGYGLTETSPVVSVNRLANPDNVSVGPPVPGFEVKIDNPDEQGNGEIVVRGPSVMKGYYKNPEATHEVLSPDGWLRTGDLGRLDSKGMLHITGRAKNLIVTAAGKNVYPEEVEAVVGQNPYIAEILVVGQLNEATCREEVHAIIVPNYELIDAERPEITEKELEDCIREQVRIESIKLADYKRIKHFELREEELPKTTTKKVKRYLFAKKPVRV
jgi:long-chain acyl-CoA synthetase